MVSLDSKAAQPLSFVRKRTLLMATEIEGGESHIADSELLGS